MNIVLIGIAMLSLFSSAVAAEADNQRATTIGVGVGREQLSNNSPDWHEHTLQLQHKFEKRHVAGLELSDIERFGMRDSRLGISYTQPLNGQLTATVDAALSPTHRTIAKNALGAALQIEFAPAWLLHLGGRTTRYAAATVNQAIFGLEHYFTDFSWAATLRPARAFGETAVSGDIRGSYYYGDRSSISLIAAAGDEATSIGNRVTLAQVQTIALTGRHWLDRRWAVTYGANHTRHGGFYTRSGINLGLQYAF